MWEQGRPLSVLAAHSALQYKDDNTGVRKAMGELVPTALVIRSDEGKLRQTFLGRQDGPALVGAAGVVSC